MNGFLDVTIYQTLCLSDRFAPWKLNTHVILSCECDSDFDLKVPVSRQLMLTNFKNNYGEL